MSFSYQFGANPTIDWPRLLISDTTEFAADGITRVYIFEDAEISTVYTMIQGFAITGKGTFQRTPSARFVAATLLDSLASDRARLGGALRVLDIEVDLGKASQALRDQAKALRDAENNDGSFAITEVGWDQFARKERLWAQIERLSGSI